jgi:hypothetical protein
MPELNVIVAFGFLLLAPMIIFSTRKYTRQALDLLFKDSKENVRAFIEAFECQNEEIARQMREGMAI